MKLSNLLIILAMFIVLTPSILGASFISASQVDWISNDPLLNKKAFLITGVENGGSQSVVFTLGSSNLGTSAQEGGYELSGSGSVKTTTQNYKINYPITTTSNRYYGLQLMCNGNDCLFFGTQVYSFSSALSFCSSFSGVSTYDIYVTKHACENGYRCWQYSLLGTQGILGTGQHEFDLFIDVTSPKGTDRIQLTEDMSTGQVDMGDNRYVYGKIQTAGRTFVSPPTPNTQYDAVYRGSDLYLTTKKSSTDFFNFYGFDGITKVLNNCVTQGYSGTECQTILNTNINQGLQRVTYSGDGTSSVVKDTTSSGRLVLSNLPTMYVQPIFSLIIDAEWFGIYRPVGKPVIVSLNAEDRYVEGEKNYITATIKNDATVDASFDFSWVCQNAQVSGTTFQEFSAGQSRNFEFQVTGQVDSGSIDASCTLTVTDSENPTVKASKSVSFDFVEQNQCAYDGKTQCVGLKIERCMPESGVLVWKHIQTCAEQCVVENGYAVCKGAIVPPVVCGDGICNADEREGGLKPCPQDCKPPKTDNTILIIGIIAGVMVLGAILLRLKKEGYFK